MQSAIKRPLLILGLGLMGMLACPGVTALTPSPTAGAPPARLARHWRWAADYSTADGRLVRLSGDGDAPQGARPDCPIQDRLQWQLVDCTISGVVPLAVPSPDDN
jgi:hypothetical protein